MSPRVGCLGGGQLGRMLALSGYPLGLEFTFLEPAADSSAGRVAPQLVGGYGDRALLERLGAESDLVTFEFESVPEESARALAAQGPVFPPPKALRIGQDRLEEKLVFQRLGIPAAPYAAVNSPAELAGAASLVGMPARLKARRLGYDGHGQVRVDSPAELEGAWAEIGGVPAILEGELAFERELSILGVRSALGETAFYPLTENHHRDSVLLLSLAPVADLRLQQQAEGICSRLLEELSYVGVLAVELFLMGGQLVANEIAPRVHNSGHWTIDGAETSQFENHLRAGLGWPLGSTRERGYSAMVNLLGALPEPGPILALSGAHLHLYSKAPRAGRKLGHVTVTGRDPERVTAQTVEVGQVLGVPLPPPRHQGCYWPS